MPRLEFQELQHIDDVKAWIEHLQDLRHEEKKSTFRFVKEQLEQKFDPSTYFDDPTYQEVIHNPFSDLTYMEKQRSAALFLESEPSDNEEHRVEFSEEETDLGDKKTDESVRPELDIPLVGLDQYVSSDEEIEKQGSRKRKRTPVTERKENVLKHLKKRKRPALNLEVGNTVIVENCEYEILEKIGRGGQAIVFCVRQKDSEQLFALKWVKDDLVGVKTEINLLKRFRGEKRVVYLHGYEIKQDHILMILELGTTDFKSILKGSKLNMRQVVVYWKEMLEAIYAVHKARVVHGDLKPANFLLTDSGLKLIDFGIAMAIEDYTCNIRREEGQGTIAYMPPEGVTEWKEGFGIKCSPAADIWSLGIIFHKMVFGHDPWGKLKFQDILVKLSLKKPPPNIQTYSSSEPDVDRWVNSVLRDTLQVCSNDRPSAEQLLSHQIFVVF